MKIPFSPPYIDEAVINEVVDSLRSGWITSGPKVKALEEEIKVFSNAKEVLCVNSWTSGAIMMLRWLGVKAGDEVIVPAYCFFYELIEGFQFLHFFFCQMEFGILFQWDEKWHETVQVDIHLF